MTKAANFKGYREIPKTATAAYERTLGSANQSYFNLRLVHSTAVVQKVASTRVTGNFKKS